jgi:hypothetical protein
VVGGAPREKKSHASQHTTTLSTLDQKEYRNTTPKRKQQRTQSEHRTEQQRTLSRNTRRSDFTSLAAASPPPPLSLLCPLLSALSCNRTLSRNTRRSDFTSLAAAAAAADPDNHPVQPSAALRRSACMGDDRDSMTAWDRGGGGGRELERGGEGAR